MNFRDVVFFWLMTAIKLLPFFSIFIICCFSSFLEGAICRFVPGRSRPAKIAYNKQSLTENMTAYWTCQCFRLYHYSSVLKPSAFISALHRATLCLLSITLHPQEDLEVCWRKKSLRSLFPPKSSCNIWVFPRDVF